MSQVKIGTGPIPVSKLAMIAIRVRYVSFTGPPTHRSLASRIARIPMLMDPGRRVSAKLDNIVEKSDSTSLRN
jgi:hypothetical protein